MISQILLCPIVRRLVRATMLSSLLLLSAILPNNLRAEGDVVKRVNEPELRNLILAFQQRMAARPPIKQAKDNKQTSQQ